MDPSQNNAKTSEDNLSIFIKGAPEKIIRRCSKIRLMSNGDLFDATLDDEAKSDIEVANKEFGERAERVLAFARIDLDPVKSPFNKSYQFDVDNWTEWENYIGDNDEKRPSGWFPMKDFTFIGLVSLKDELRPDVQNTIAKLRGAGIKTVMMTGD